MANRWLLSEARANNPRGRGLQWEGEGGKGQIKQEKHNNLKEIRQANYLVFRRARLTMGLQE